MSRPIKNMDTGHPRQVRLDGKTFMKLLSIRDMMGENIGVDSLHLNQVISVLINDYIKRNRKETTL